MAEAADTHNGAPNPQEETPTTAAPATAEPDKPAAAPATPKWPGWPGHNVFRLIVPVQKVGSIIGRKGELVKKLCDETRARIRVLDAPVGTNDRVVLISGKEEPDAPLSPAMDAVIKVFKRVIGLGSNEGDDKSLAANEAAFCSIRLLVASSQAINLIGKQGSTIKSMQENSGAVVRILPEDELPSYASSDERLAEIHGEAAKVLKAFELVIGHLRKFLVDQSVVSVFEKNYNARISRERTTDAPADGAQFLAQHAPSHMGITSDHSLSLKRDSYFDRETLLDTKLPQSSLSLYGLDSTLSGLPSTGLTRPAASIVTTITQTMQVPLSYAEDIIGVRGANIAYIRRTSGAILTVQESGGRPDEITVEIKGSMSEVQTAQQLIQDFISGHKEPTSSIYGKPDTGLSSYSQLPETTYRPSSYSTSSLGGYGSSSLGGYGGSYGY